MADEGQMVFPDEVDNMEATGTGGVGTIATTSPDEDRIIFPDEVEDAKARARAVRGAGVETTNAELDHDRIVFPDEFEEIKARAAAAALDDADAADAPDIDPRNKLE